MKRRVASLIASILVVGAGVASAEIFHLGNMTLRVDGGISPTALPKREMAPISLWAEGEVTTDDGSTPPVVKGGYADFDKNGTLDTRGLPQCDPRKLENTLTKDALEKCGDALIGRGQTRATIDFPDQDPFDATGPLLAFNGKPIQGDPSVVFHVFAHVPAPTTFVVPARVSDSPRPGFGKRITIRVPPISGGNGVLVEASIEVERQWRYRGERHSYLLARCANRRLKAYGRIEFIDGQALETGIVRSCTQRR